MQHLIFKILSMTHLHWVSKNILLHDNQQGHLRRQEMRTVMIKTETLLDTRPDGTLEHSKVLLDFDHTKLRRSNIHDKAK